MRWQELAGGRAGSQAAAAVAHDGGGGAGTVEVATRQMAATLERHGAAVRTRQCGHGRGRLRGRSGAGAVEVSGERRRCASGELGHGGGETRGVRRRRGRKREEHKTLYEGLDPLVTR
jgi:hypothetical protein